MTGEDSPKSAFSVVSLLTVPAPCRRTLCLGRPRPHRRDSHPARARYLAGPRDGRYYRARYYHPGFQRLIAEDPIGFEGGDVNLYAYVRNNPLGLHGSTGAHERSCLR